MSNELDAYWFSINQNPDGSYAYAYDLGGSSPAGASGIPNPAVFMPPNPQGYSGLLKINASNFSIANAQIAQGFYDSLNIADGSKNVTISGLYSVSGPSGERVITVKGGCLNITLIGTVTQPGNNWFDGDISIDDWIDQTYAASSGIDLSGLKAPYGKIKVVANYRASKITFGPNCRRAILPSLVRTGYWYAKRVVRAIFRVPLGTSGWF